MRKLASIVFAISLISCNNSSTSNTATSSGDSSAASTSTKTTASESNSGDVASIIKVTVTGGPHAGTYTVTSKETTCSMGLTGDKSFGNQYSENNKGDKELSSLQLIVNNADEAKAGTSKFMVTVGFGKLLGGDSYTIDGTKEDHKKGSGTAKLTESGKDKTVDIDGTTADGVHITATLTCKSVMTANGVQ